MNVGLLWSGCVSLVPGQASLDSMRSCRSVVTMSIVMTIGFDSGSLRIQTGFFGLECDVSFGVAFLRIPAQTMIPDRHPAQPQQLKRNACADLVGVVRRDLQWLCLKIFSSFSPATVLPGADRAALKWMSRFSDACPSLVGCLVAPCWVDWRQASPSSV